MILSARLESLAGDSRAAISTLEEALVARPHEPKLWAGLGAALYPGDSGARGGGDRLLASIEASLQADSIPVAACNLSRALSELGLQHRFLLYAEQCPDEIERFEAELQRARAVIARGPGSAARPDLRAIGAASTSRSRRRTLAGPSESPTLEGFRELLEGRDMRPEATLRELGGALDSAQALELAEDYESLSGNPQPRRLIAELKSLAGERRHLMLRMLADWRTGWRRLENYQVSDARASFESAQRAGRRLESALLPSIELALATCEYQSGDTAALAERLKRMAAEKMDSGLPAVEARRLWLEALVLQGRGDWEDALGAIDRAAGIQRRLRESESAAWLGMLRSISLDALRRDDEAADEIVWSLETLTASANTRRAAGAMVIAAEIEQRRGRPGVAIELLREANAWDQADGNPTLVVDSLATLASALLSDGRYREARAAVASSRQMLRRVDDEAARTRVETFLDLAEAEAEIRLRPELASELLSRILLRAEEFDEVFTVIGALRLRARAHIARGADERAVDDLERAVEEGIRQAAKVGLTVERSRLLDSARAPLDELVELLTSDRAAAGPVKALAWIERLRLAQLGEPPESVAVVEARIRALELPRGACFVSSFAGRSKVETWTRCGSGPWRFTSTVTSSGALRLAVDRFRRDLRGAALADLRASAAVLSGLVLPRGRKELEESVYWIVVPDALLSMTPYGWLSEPGGSAFVWQRRSVVRAPALALLESAADRTVGRLQSVVAFGVATAGDDGELPMERLRYAEEEAQLVGEGMPGGRALVGAAASVDHLDAALARADSIHIASHFLPPGSEELGDAAFVANGPTKESRRVRAARLLELSRNRLKFAFLSGCGSAAGARGAIAGSDDFATALLMGGVRQVVATNWEILDADYSPFIEPFYASLHRTGNAAEALRAALKAAKAGESDDQLARSVRAYEALTIELPKEEEER